MTKRSFISLCLFFIASIAYAQDGGVDSVALQDTAWRRTIGMGAALQEAQFDMLFPFWLGDRATIALSFGLSSAEDGDVLLFVGMAPRYYFSMARLAPYVSLRAGALLGTPPAGEGTTDMILGLASGGEYFFDPQFSLGVESQLNFVVSDKNSTRFGNPGKLNINTAAAVIATVYF